MTPTVKAEAGGACTSRAHTQGGRAIMTFTVKHVEEIEAQLDSTAPYYLPAVLKDFKAALATLVEIASGECADQWNCGHHSKTKPEWICGRCRAKLFIQGEIGSRRVSR